MNATTWVVIKTQCLQRFTYVLAGAVAEVAFTTGRFARFEFYIRPDVSTKVSRFWQLSLPSVPTRQNSSVSPGLDRARLGLRVTPARK